MGYLPPQSIGNFAGINVQIVTFRDVSEMTSDSLV